MTNNQEKNLRELEKTISVIKNQNKNLDDFCDLVLEFFKILTDHIDTIENKIKSLERDIKN